MTNRRDLLIVLGAAALMPQAVRAQAPARVRRIGLISALSSSDTARWHEAFRLGMRDLGWVEGKNVSFEYRYADGRTERLPALAADLVRLKVEVIIATATSDAQAAQKATKAIPIIVTGGDAVVGGLAETLARPGGNVTGLSSMVVELAGKRLELLQEMLPKLSRVAVLWNPRGVVSPLTREEIQLPARRLGIQLQSLEVRNPDDLDKAVEEATRARAGALFLTPDAVINTNLKRIAGLAAKSRLPSIFHRSEFVEAGGLTSYGVDRTDAFRRAATLVDKILKGAKPGDLPIERPTRFELVINMKTAKALGLTIPQSVLVRADRVIE